MSWTGDKQRTLTRPEKMLAHSVFTSTLPPWNQIKITNGVGAGNSYWTQYVGQIYQIEEGGSHPEWRLHLKEIGFRDALLIKATFIHELAHVWQSYHSGNPGSYMIKAAWEHTTKRDPYLFAAGKPWGEYGIEQQAQLVEEWFKAGASHNDPLFPYIEHHIWTGRKNSSPYLMIPEHIEARRPVSQGGKEKPKRIVFEGVLFAFDSAELKPEAATRLSEAIVLLSLRKTARVVIAGHTDSVGSAAYNKRLSAERAKAVKNWFVQRGVQGAANFEVVGYGEDYPIASNATPEGRRRNRRVEIIYA